GPDHDKRFDADVFVDEELYGVGSGTSKKAAEQVAAAEALERLEREEDRRTNDQRDRPGRRTNEEARPGARAS
ncbi:MAG: putative dsRNA-binding protein, partial [Actinomycetota bacterium]|nr:putative dsRNA-binding protein [Actinomycetota bacterium]